MLWLENLTSEEKEFLDKFTAENKIPKHIGIIMDGNGRWAQNKQKPRLFGHREGIESVREIVRESSLSGVKFLTLYAFSIENWKRPATEVAGLMHLLEVFLKKDVNELHENNVCIKTIGKTSSLPKSVQKILYAAIDRTRENTGLVLVLALSYGSRFDIVRAAQMIALDARRGKVSPEDITEEYFASALQTNGFLEPDLIIRTSGELRLSNFLLWESAYSELYVTPKLWPEFRKNDFYDALIDFNSRERRFGKTSSQIVEDNQNNSYLKRVVDVFKK